MEARRALLGELIAIHAARGMDGEFGAMLRSCSLVCRNLHSVALSHMFHHVHLSNRNRVRKLVDLCRPSNYPIRRQGAQELRLPNPLTFIRSVSLTTYGDDDVTWMEDEPRLPALLHDIRMHGLKGRSMGQFRLSTEQGLAWTRCSEALRRGIADIICSNPPASLELSGIDDLPESVLLQGVMRSRVVHVECVSVQPSRDDREATELAIGLLSAPIQELSIITSPGVFPILARFLESSGKGRLRGVKRLVVGDIEFQELPSTLRVIERLVEAGCAIESIALAPILSLDEEDATEFEKHDTSSLPPDVFGTLRYLDVEFQSLYADSEGKRSIAIVLEQLFSRVAQAWAPWHQIDREDTARRPSLKHLVVRVFMQEEEAEEDMAIALLEAEGSWRNLVASLGCLNPVLEQVDIRILCRSCQDSTLGRTLEARLQGYFACLKVENPTLELQCEVVILGSRD
ncbi:hypothetical protein CC1G_00157 [Coprinopsis cinerea okayama7|uniref:F-box domain-containing protein n=1 Tax=Coprinopsis cinerea (strain Okayama-7 / 130 / ATCC MYA-4618 / FGSC 9003) TaxID=240176 RepID=A8NWY9_COPC7|nr:hypothetical protein CC1G_00157 [Coprinopsis cinerea okayama7\|eukprot:XP_001837021.1 hypothetical protein CC1G_00157 [Coprinopsis cinerea okayama7\